jgi:hypothetical protein
MPLMLEIPEPLLRINVELNSFQQRVVADLVRPGMRMLLARMKRGRVSHCS